MQQEIREHELLTNPRGARRTPIRLLPPTIPRLGSGMGMEEARLDLQRHLPR